VSDEQEQSVQADPPQDPAEPVEPEIPYGDVEPSRRGGLPPGTDQRMRIIERKG
jgi:hypothetical protein